MNRIFTLFIIGASLAFSMSSCNDWLDVRPDTEQKEKDQFATEKGFQTALTGCYMEMASEDAYGTRMTLTNVENLANLWVIDKATTRKDDYELSSHDYDGDNAKTAVKAIYSSLFKSITQANLIIKNAEVHADAFTTKGMKEIITGEAYAIRAYCQFDVLRLFGQVPQGAQKKVLLPYSEATTIDEIPAYYSFEDYVAKLTKDIETAESLLKDNDPAVRFAYSDLNRTDDDYVSNDFLIFRQMRLNYWAVRALHARMALYTGDNKTAYSIAKELITAKLPDGNAVRPLSGTEDFQRGYLSCPNECYFSLSKYDIKSIAAQIFTLNDDNARYRSQHQVISSKMLTELYAGENTEAHNRYNSLWNQRLLDPSAKPWCGFRRYSFDDNAAKKSLYYQVIPMLRASETYLIAMETATDLAEANSLYKTYMLAHNVVTTSDFTSLDDMKAWIEDEYRREFYGEGQMFYTYKRLGETDIKWMSTPATELTYIIPLPETEYSTLD